ncbi:MAG: FliI/YscN family ATPase [Phycisphaerales bacterium]|nr:FliI/YscN family ATPase [Phycisphaerales bacterium]
MNIFATARETMAELQTCELVGTVSSIRGLTVLVERMRVPIGSIVRLESGIRGGAVMRGEVVGFDGARSIVMLYGEAEGISPGDRCIGERTSATVQVGRSLLGRVVDGLARPIDGRDAPTGTTARLLNPVRTSPLQRTTIDTPIMTGIRTIDGLTTVGKGQRLGIFAGPGVGKSTLLGTIARNTSADVNVIALVGERGREVVDFVEETLGPEGLERSVVVVATGDESPLMRVRACLVALAAAEYFRDLGLDVLLTVDSLTRFAHAQRQIGLAIGEQPATKGFTPSVFAMLPRLLERAGSLRDGGSITGLYTVLAEGDELADPIADAAKGVLDGHVLLTPELAAKGHYPAIDPIRSVSRAADRLVDEHVLAARRDILSLIAAHKDAEELISIGAYATGSNPDVDIAIALQEQLQGFLRQASDECFDFPRTCRLMIELHGIIDAMRAQLAQSGAGVAADPSRLGGVEGAAA